MTDDPKHDFADCLFADLETGLRAAESEIARLRGELHIAMGDLVASDRARLSAIAERDQARAGSANLRNVLAEAEALIRDLELGADQRSQSHADVLAKITAYDAAARGMAIVRRLMGERDATQ